MSQAEELLNSLTEEEMLAYTIDPSTEPHVVIGQDRSITVPKMLEKIAVQYDHNIETVTFDCPRYWDGIDMSGMYIYINYLRADKKPGMYKAENITVDGTDSSVMHFTWTISRNITEVVGNITFLVCVKSVDSEGNENVHWNSDICKKMYVSEGLECSDVITEEYPDIISQLLGIVGINIDNVLSLESTYPVENKVITAKLNEIGSDMEIGDASTLGEAKVYSDEKDIETLGSAKTYTNERVDSLELQMALEDTDILNEAKSYTDEQKSVVEANMASQNASTLTEAKTYSDELVNAESTVRAEGDVNAVIAANEYTDEKISSNKIQWMAADTDILTNAKEYTDEKVATEVTARTEGDASTLSSGKTYTNEKVATEAKLRESGDDNTLRNAKSYADDVLATEVENRTEGDSNTLKNAKTYADEIVASKISTEVTARTKGDTDTLASGKAYTDEKIAALINGAPSTLDTLKEVADAMSENANVVEALNDAIGTKAPLSDLTTHVGDSENPHNVTKEQIGLSNVENKTSEDIRGELTKDNVVNALGYTPPKTDTTYSEASTSASGLMSAEDKVKVGYLDNVTSDVQGQIDELSGNVDELGGVVTDIQEDVTSLNEEITDLGTSVQGYIDNINTKIDNINTEIDNNYTMLDTNINSLAAGVEQHVDSLQAQIDGLDADVVKLEEADTDIQNQIDNLAVGSVTGEYITVNDSAGDGVVEFGMVGKSEQTKINGYQLFDCNKLNSTYTSGGATITNSGDGSFTITGSGTLTNTVSISHNYTHEESLKLLKPGTLKITYSNSNVYPLPYVFIKDSTGTTIKNISETNPSFKITQDILDEGAYLGIGVWGTTGLSIKEGTTNVMLYIDGDGTWEPFVGGIPSPNPGYPQEIESVGKDGSVEVVSCGKNLIPVSATNKTENDLECTVNSDGTILINGTATANTEFNILPKTTFKAGKYIIVGCPNGGSTDTYFINISIDGRYSVQWREVGQGIVIERDTDFVLGAGIYISKDVTIKNLLFKPMLTTDLNATYDDFEPYISSQATLQVEPLRSLPNGTADELIFNRDGSGKVVRRVGEVVLDGSEDEEWLVNARNETKQIITFDVKGVNNVKYIDNTDTENRILSDIFVGKDTTTCITNTTLEPYTCTIITNNRLYFTLPMSLLTELTEFIAWLKENPITVQYELQTPTEESLTADQVNELLSLKTFESVTNLYSNDSVQPEMSMSYLKNTNVGKALTGFRSNVATDIHAGLMSAEDKVKVDEMDITTAATAKASGTSMTISDASSSPFSSFEMTGKSSQVTYTGKQLLNATLATTTKNGITCTDNGDGTYTLNGTATSDAYFTLISFPFTTSNSYKLIGCPKNGTTSTYFLTIASSTTEIGVSKTDDIGDGVSFTPTIDNNAIIEIRVISGITVSNLTFKPMLTTDLEATYDDFEPYCGGIPSPNPEYPQTINSVAECVEMMQGCFKVADGSYSSEAFIVTTKDIIPCKAGDVINIKTEVLPNWVSVLYYKDGVYKSNEDIKASNDCSVTIPEDINGFRFNIQMVATTYITPETVGKIEVKYNGLYGIPIKSVSENLINTTLETKAILTLAEPLRSLPNGVSDTIECNVDGSYKVVRRVGAHTVSDGTLFTHSNGNKGLVVTPTNRYLTPHELLITGDKYSHCDMAFYDKLNAASNSYQENPYNFVLTGTTDDTLETLKELYAGATIFYRLATPTEETLTAEQVVEILNLQTFENITNVMTGDSLQPEMSVEYYKNTNVGKACGSLCAKLNALIKG